MAGYAVRIKASVEKDIAALPGEVVLRILQDIEALSETPLPPGVRKLSGAEHLLPDSGRRLPDYMRCESWRAGGYNPLCPPPAHCISGVVTPKTS